MYAVLTSGGKQYRVEAGTTLELERLVAEPGATVTFDRVLLLADGDRVTVGTPLVAGATVSATVLGQALGPKLIIFKFKQKVKYRRRRGHRQQLTRVRIDAINADETHPKRVEAATTEPDEVAAPVAPAEASPAPEAATPRVESAPEPQAAEKVERKAPARRRTATKTAEPDVETDTKGDVVAQEAAEAPAAEAPAAEAPAAETKPKARRTTRPKKSTTAQPAEEN